MKTGRKLSRPSRVHDAARRFVWSGPMLATPESENLSGAGEAIHFGLRLACTFAGGCHAWICLILAFCVFNAVLCGSATTSITNKFARLLQTWHLEPCVEASPSEQQSFKL